MVITRSEHAQVWSDHKITCLIGCRSTGSDCTVHNGSCKVCSTCHLGYFAITYALWLWLSIGSMSAKQTRIHASLEDPKRALADVLLIMASVLSLVAVGFMILESSSSSGTQKALEIALGLTSVFVSWAAVHTTFSLKYADLYYKKPEGGIDFNESDSPKYSDFAYLAFTIGMTFQVSDTNIKTKNIRALALRHALLSYLFGAVIIATTINTIASLGK